ncbi:MAG TPA: biopolymer transporter ExbD, partial [Planctomycetia bacterium]|nr:biopolymer transporter ExbD [Planctomycetia bacterium]
MAFWDVLLVAAGRQLEGVDEQELRRMLREGELSPEDCLRRAGESRWRRVKDLKDRPSAEDKPLAAIPVDEEWEEAPVAAVPAEAARPAAVAQPARGGRKTAVAAVPLGSGGGHDDHEDEWEGGHGGHRVEIEPNDMTPMVDVVLLLLMFFMVTASYTMQKILEIPKPNPESKPSLSTKQQILKEYLLVEIDDKNKLMIDNDPFTGRDLVTALRNASKESGKNKMFLLAAGASH